MGLSRPSPRAGRGGVSNGLVVTLQAPGEGSVTALRGCTTEGKKQILSEVSGAQGLDCDTSKWYRLHIGVWFGSVPARPFCVVLPLLV